VASAFVIVVTADVNCHAQGTVNATDADTPKAAFLAVFAKNSDERKKAEATPISFDVAFAESSMKTNLNRLTHMKVYWDGKSVFMESAKLVYVSTPYRAFILFRKAEKEPFSIRAITPVSDAPRTLQDIFSFERQLELGLDKPLRPTGPNKFFGNLVEAAPYEAASPMGTKRIVGKAILPDGRITFSYATEGAEPSDHGDCTIDPQWGNSVVQFRSEKQYKDMGPVSTKVDYAYYEPSAELPFWLVKEYHCHVVTPKVAKLPQLFTEARYSNYRRAQMPSEKLTLAYYGLPDPANAAGKQAILWWVVLGFGVLTVGGLVLWVRRQGTSQ
jgi:hypothetical protein